MIVWRVAHRDFTKLDGLGAKMRGGRWSSPGKPVVYTSSHLSLAVLEVLVHLEVDVEDLPDDYVSIEIEVPDNTSIRKMKKKIELHDMNVTQGYGDKWLNEEVHTLLEVKSVVIPKESNILINPEHAGMKRIRSKNIEPFTFDQRLLGG